MLVLRFYGSGALSGIFKFNSPAAAADFEFSPAFMVFEKITQPDSADDVARVVYSRRPAAEAARVNNSRHTCCCIYFSKTINAGTALPPPHFKYNQRNVITLRQSGRKIQHLIQNPLPDLFGVQIDALHD